jgi:arsenate reductase
VPGAVTRLHWSFEDPSRATGSDEARLTVFRRVRDQIEARIAQWLSRLQVTTAT